MQGGRALWEADLDLDSDLGMESDLVMESDLDMNLDLDFECDGLDAEVSAVSSLAKRR